ncbi:hypothetical protein CC80DRAFT_526036 [Byssothecium circinans]|uniref:Spherulin-4 n=1 Tax=Byssothecium circinans TaxID=147558 RepID=A0A6A5TVZ0_9PLEO|nr:hypothetical protein CC80DRAFT_526036 [Byssothecium circinans]
MHPRWHQGAGPHARGKRRNAGIGDIDEHVFARSVTLTLALLFIIGIPLGAILPQKYVKQLPINVLVPLYIDPTSGGWERLFNAVIKHSETNFTVIVNPSHGPGTAAWPSGIYVEALERLNKFSNVQTVGYIDTERGARSNVTVFKEVETYAGWNQSKIAVSGIFFDRTPFEEWEREGNNTSDEGTAKEYLRNITEAVRHAEGFLRRKVVIHSPGSVPNVNLTSAHADVTVVFEGAYAEIPARGWMREKLVSLGKRREEFAYLVHDVPKGIKRGGVRRIIDGSRRNIEWLFVTNQGGDDRIEAHPTLNFLVIINPNSGPGSEPWWPNVDYVRDISKLNAYTNVQTLGYVATTYCKRPVKEVFADIAKYAVWSEDERCPGLGVNGIFFDETPNLYSEDVKMYLDAISASVKSSEGISGDRMVIHNPGTAVEEGLAHLGPDITTVAEVAHRDFDSGEFQLWLNRSPCSREKSSYMIHSTPEDKVEELVLTARERAAYIFVTDLDVDYYHSFGGGWERFVAAMAE